MRPVAILAVLGMLTAGAADDQFLEQAKAVHKRILAFDTHLDLPFDYPGAAADGKTQFDRKRQRKPS